MNKRSLLITLSLLLLVAAVVFRLVKNKRTVEEAVFRYDPDKPLLVPAETLRWSQVRDTLSFTGTFEAERETRLSAEIPGKVLRVLADVGTEVHKGQALIELDAGLLRLQLRSTEIQLEGLQADVSRYAVLASADAVQGVQLEKANLGLRTAQAQRSLLLEQIERMTIRAPFNAVVSAKLVETGNYAAPGVPMMQLTDISKLRFVMNVPERQLQYFRRDQIADLRCDACNWKGTGKVISIGSKSGPGNLFPVHFRADNTRDQMIKAGMFGKAFLPVGPEGRVLTVPSSAVLSENGEDAIYVIEQGKAVLRPVVIGRRVGQNAIVLRGLDAGEVMISGGFLDLYDGAAVRTE
ncbi:MAG: efflux RND transporter periplasmic adaptor subunit [Saprospiraceae bacterium]|nr:efflux RND transporter periplasmic adaptor subunit [Saprospiraceae bacterium]